MNLCDQFNLDLGTIQHQSMDFNFSFQIEFHCQNILLIY